MRAFIKRVTGLATLAIACLPSGASFAQANMDEGRKLFTQVAVPACAVCHTLKHADATGEIGPNLDELKPDASQVEKAVRNGIGQMPAFKTLDDAQIAALAKYVAAVAGAAK